jgi:hypothetical protein
MHIETRFLCNLLNKSIIARPQIELKQVTNLAGQIRGTGHGFVRTGGPRILAVAGGVRASVPVDEGHDHFAHPDRLLADHVRKVLFVLADEFNQLLVRDVIEDQ